MERPWITPQEVKDYSDLNDVITRNDTKLKTDIRRAESYIMHYTHNTFPDEEYTTVPEDIKVACIILAEYFAHNSKLAGSKTSETFDDYSYTMNHSEIDVTSLGLDTLLEAFVNTKASGKTTMRLRKL